MAAPRVWSHTMHVVAVLLCFQTNCQCQSTVGLTISSNYLVSNLEVIGSFFKTTA